MASNLIESGRFCNADRSRSEAGQNLGHETISRSRLLVLAVRPRQLPQYHRDREGLFIWDCAQFHQIEQLCAEALRLHRTRFDIR